MLAEVQSKDELVPTVVQGGSKLTREAQVSDVEPESLQSLLNGTECILMTTFDFPGAQSGKGSSVFSLTKLTSDAVGNALAQDGYAPSDIGVPDGGSVWAKGEEDGFSASQVTLIPPISSYNGGKSFRYGAYLGDVDLWQLEIQFVSYSG
jgi:hypothetical protein